MQARLLLTCEKTKKNIDDVLAAGSHSSSSNSGTTSHGKSGEMLLSFVFSMGVLLPKSHNNGSSDDSAATAGVRKSEQYPFNVSFVHENIVFGEDSIEENRYDAITCFR